MSQSGVVYAVNKGEKIARERNYQLLELVADLQMECPRVSTPTPKEKPNKSITIFDYHKTNASSELLEEPC